MNTISGLLGAGAITRGVGQVLAVARGANPSAAARVNAKAGGDTLEISPEAKSQLASAAQSRPSVRLEEIRVEYEAGLRELEQRLVGLVKEADIEIGDGFQLESTADGRVVVVGHHARKDEIEQLFADHADLRELVKRLDQQAALLSKTDSEATRRRQENLTGQNPRLRLTMTGAGLQASAQ